MSVLSYCLGVLTVLGAICFLGTLIGLWILLQVYREQKQCTPDALYAGMHEALLRELGVKH